MADGVCCATALKLIEKGSRFGPLEANKLLTLDPNIQLPLKLFSKNIEDLSECYLDTCDEDNCNWMIFVLPAQNIEEQNLICFQEKSAIYYVVYKDIQIGEHLKLWYSPHYAKKMGFKELTSDCLDYNAQTVDINKLLKKQQNIGDRDNWTCKFCGKLENNVSSFALHMLNHYSRKVTKVICDFCKQVFGNKLLLKKHQREVHKIGDSKNLKPKIISNETKSKDSVGGPLLNTLSNDNLDNSNLTLDLNQFNITVENSMENQNILLENDAINLNEDNLLLENVKELDHFNFEITESQEQYICDICLKSFTRLFSLRQHMKKHTGQYTCRHCLKIFSRRENLQSHICNEFKAFKFTCNICQSKFMLKKYLHRHMNAKHIKKYACVNCHKNFYSNKDFKDHNCSAIPNTNKQKFTCALCSKDFFSQKYLKRHLKTHAEKEKRRTFDAQKFICEVCAQEFTTYKGLRLHSLLHQTSTLECDICNKKFYRKDVLSQHRMTHFDIRNIKCELCSKEFKTNQSLSVHMRLHSAEKLYRCNSCTKSFCQHAALLSHKEKFHSMQCFLCKKKFENEELLNLHKRQHAVEYYVCPLCSKYLKLRSSLRRHLKLHHHENDLESLMLQVNPKRVKLMESKKIQCDNVSLSDKNLENDHNNSLNLNDNFINEDDNNLNRDINDIMNYSCDNSGYVTTRKSNTQTNEDNNDDINNIQINFESNLNIQNSVSNENEICLSMPDLNDCDHEITLGENAYMLEDGTIVEPKEQGKVYVYMLSQNNYS